MARRVSYRQRSLPRRFFRPCLEALEARWLPTGLVIPQGDSPPVISPVGAVRPLTDLTKFTTLDRGDDNSSAQVTMPFAVNFFGKNNLNEIYVNNNGSLTFDSPLGVYTPFSLRGSTHEILAPFFADVDTSAPFGSGEVTYGKSIIDGHKAFVVTWNAVTPFVGDQGPTPTVTDTFQAVLIDRSDVTAGDFDLEFNYGPLQWDTATASGSDSARAGFAAGTDADLTSLELPGSTVSGGLLDTNSQTGLSNHSLNSKVTGRYIFYARDGVLAAEQPPVLDPIAPLQTSEGQALTFTVVGHDPNPITSQLTYDLAGAPAGATIDPDTGVVQWTPSPTEPAGVYSINVRVAQHGTIPRWAAEPVQVTVLDVTPSITLNLDHPALAGSPFTASGSFQDLVVGQWKATVDYGEGDGTQPLDLVSTDQQAYTFTLQHTFATDSIASVTVNIIDSDGGNAVTGQVFVLPGAAENYKIASADPTHPANSTLVQQDVTGNIDYRRKAGSTTTSFVLYGDKPVDTSRTGKFFDIKVVDPQSNDGLIFTITSPLLQGKYEFGYFKPGTNVWISLLNRPDLANVQVNPVTGILTATLVLGPDGVPLAGTIFAITTFNPTTTSTTIQPPVAQANTGTSFGVASDSGLGLAVSVTFTSSTQLSVPLTASQNGQLAISGASQGSVTGPLRGSSITAAGSGSNQQQTTDEEEDAFWRWLPLDEGLLGMGVIDADRVLFRATEERSSPVTEHIQIEVESTEHMPIAHQVELPTATRAKGQSSWMLLGLLPGLTTWVRTRSLRLDRIRRENAAALLRP